MCVTVVIADAIDVTTNYIHGCTNNGGTTADTIFSVFLGKPTILVPGSKQFPTTSLLSCIALYYTNIQTYLLKLKLF